MNASHHDPRVTVFIPTYNRAKWLPGAIESVLAQSWPHFRLVVSDNASTDETPEIVAGFDDPRLSYTRLEHHVELIDHFNLCFGRSDTEYVVTLPDDDRLVPDSLERSVPMLDRNPHAGMAHGQATVVDADGAVIAERHCMAGLTANTVESGQEFIRQSMSVPHRVHASSALIRTEAVSSVRLGPDDSPIPDLGHWLRVALWWDIAFIAHPLGTSRIHTSAASAKVASVGAGGYAPTVDGLLTCHDVKSRFIDENRRWLQNPGDLIRRARAGTRKQLLAHAARSTLPERRMGATTRALADLSRLDPRVLLEPKAWRLFAGGILGQRGVSTVKHMLRQPS